MNSPLTITGELHIRHERRGVLLGEYRQKNLATDGLKTAIAAKLAGSGTGGTPSHMACGSGTNAAAAGDTTLQTEIGRVALNSQSSVANVTTLIAVFNPADCVGSWNELGLFTAGVAGTLTNRVKLNTTIPKSDDDTVTVTWTITVN
jgi:hypothetical protein